MNKSEPNQSAAADGGATLHLQSMSQWPAAAELVCSICMRTILQFALVWGMMQANMQGAEAAKSIYAEKARARLEALAKNQSNTQFLLSVTNLPMPVLLKLGRVADAGQPFSSGCLGDHPHRRFLGATRAGQTYNVAIEEGGFVYMWSVLEFVTDKTGKVVGERRIEPDGAANRSQPVGSETNRTSSAAGSGG